MTDNWEQTSEISMTVQSAEMRVPSLAGGRHLLLSCRLVNIARGSCRLEVHPTHDDEAGENILHIPIDRPVMQGVLHVAPDLFAKMSTDVMRSDSRPVNIVVTLAEALAVSIAGDLRIDEETSIKVADASFVFSMK
jgi:hypothetical protein